MEDDRSVFLEVHARCTGICHWRQVFRYEYDWERGQSEASARNEALDDFFNHTLGRGETDDPQLRHDASIDEPGHGVEADCFASVDITYWWCDRDWKPLPEPGKQGSKAM